MYYRARQYSPELGRFISEDPIGFAGEDINLYAYVGNNSINTTDPLGLCGIDKQKCAALIRRMLGEIGEMKRLLERYDPVKDFMGGFPWSNPKKGTSGVTKPFAHYNGIKDAQNALVKNLAEFKRACMDNNDSNNTGLPSEAEEYARKPIQAPYDPNAPVRRNDSFPYPSPTTTQTVVAVGTTVVIVVIAIIGTASELVPH